MLTTTDKILLFGLFWGLSSLFQPVYSQDLEIWEIQGASLSSPFVGKEVTTTANVVTAVGNGFFFLQSPASQSDNNPATSDGIYVASTQAVNRKVGDLIKVKGIVLEQNGRTQIGQGSIQFTFIRSGETLPPISPLGEAFPSGMVSTPNELERIEGMRIQISGMSTGPSDYRDMVPVVARTERPFREPGIKFPGLPNLPVWDGNPEIIWMLPNGLDQPANRFITAKTPITATGPLVQIDQDYVLLPEQYTLGSSLNARPVRTAKEGEFTISSFNVRRLMEEEERFNDKARKLAKYIVEMLHSPDLLALQEIGSSTALSTLSFFINQLDPDVVYTPYFLSGNGEIHLAYLVNPAIFSNVEVIQLGKELLFSEGGLLFDRPPLLFSASLADDPNMELNVLNLHLRSLLGIEGDDQDFVRKKRYAQSLEVAKMVENLERQNLLVLGDLNAFPFSDGYVDVVNQISGKTSLGSLFPVQPILSSTLNSLMSILPDEDQYSFVFDGSAQLIDHALVGDFQNPEITEIAFARANADFPDAFAPNEALVLRASDHDGFVIYFKPSLPSGLSASTLKKTVKAFPNPIHSGNTLHLIGLEEYKGAVYLISNDGKTLRKKTWSPGTQRWDTMGLPAGIYQLKWDENHRNSPIKIVVLP